MRRFGNRSCVDLWASLRLDKSKMRACINKAGTIQDELPSPLVQTYWTGRWVTIPFCITVVKSWPQSPGGTSIQCKAQVDIQHCAFAFVAFVIWCVDFYVVILCSSICSFVCDWPMYVWKSVWATCGLLLMQNNANADEIFQIMIEIIRSSLLPNAESCQVRVIFFPGLFIIIHETILTPTSGPWAEAGNPRCCLP